MNNTPDQLVRLTLRLHTRRGYKGYATNNLKHKGGQESRDEVNPVKHFQRRRVICGHVMLLSLVNAHSISMHSQAHNDQVLQRLP